jgi:predicted RNA-binding Zn-ribbon protein involved in translation (DUF1610 family)
MAFIMVPTNRHPITEETETETQAEIDPNAAVTCPACGNERICRTHREGKRDRIISFINIYPYYCREHTCQHRFYRFGRKI